MNKDKWDKKNKAKAINANLCLNGDGNDQKKGESGGIKW